MHWGFLRSLNKKMPSAIASKLPGAQGDRYKCRLLEFFAKSLQASIETRYNEGFYGLRTRIYYQQQSLRYLVPRVTGINVVF